MEKILKSLLITLAVSSLLGLILLIFKINFWATFAFATITQYIIFFIVGSVVEYIGQLKLRELEVTQIKELAKQQIEVECPCDKKIKEYVNITLGERNTYRCTECSKVNAIYINATTAATNIPIGTDK